MSLNLKKTSAQHSTYWAYQFAGWCSVTVFFTLSFGSMMPAGYTKMGIIYSWGAITGLSLSHAWRLLLKNRGWLHNNNARTPWFTMGAMIVLLGIAQSLCVGLGFGVMQPAGMIKNNWDWLPGAIVGWVTIFAVWTAIYAFVISKRRAKQLEAEALRLEIYAKDAELRALQAQVNPHFFFNSLNSVRGLIFENPSAAAQMIDQLAGIMRYALQSNENATVTLAKEMEAVNAYLAIEKIRFEERLICSTVIEAGLETMLIPPMAVQTLVENAVKYGVERNLSGSEIRIAVKRIDNVNVNGEIQIEVANRGTIMPSAATKNSTQLGLDNTRKRLSIMATAATLNLTQTNGWVHAVITMPEKLNANV